MRKNILNAAEHVFAEAGFGGATMQLIADMAGLPKANLHYYFPTKEALYRRVVDNIFQIWLDAAAVFDDADGPIEGIGAYIDAKMEISRRHPAGSKVWAAEVMHGAPVIQDYLETTLREWTEGRARVIRPLDRRRQDEADRSASSALYGLGDNPALCRFRPPDRHPERRRTVFRRTVGSRQDNRKIDHPRRHRCDRA